MMNADTFETVEGGARVQRVAARARIAASLRATVLAAAASVSVVAVCAAESVPTAAERPTVIVVAGAPGEAEFTPDIALQMDT